MDILGVSAFYHDSAACLVRDGEIVAAAQEERFTRKKHDARFPRNAVRYCLREGGIALGDLRYVAFYDKPLVKFERLLETYLACAPKGLRSFVMAMPVWLKEKLFTGDALRRELGGRAITVFGVEGWPACGTPTEALHFHGLDGESLAERIALALGGRQ
jgi:carbamoyltransferase